MICPLCGEYLACPEAWQVVHISHCNGRTLIAYDWSPDDYTKLSPIVQDARRLLQTWFDDMEAGVIDRRLPNPFHKPAISMTVVDAIMAHLDREFEKELHAWAHQEIAGSYTDGPGFSRLKPVQRLALAQDLHRLKIKYSQAAERSTASNEAHVQYYGEVF